MNKEEFIALAEKISKGTANDSEIGLYDAYYQYFQQGGQNWNEAETGVSEQVSAELLGRITRQIQPSAIHPFRRPVLKWVGMAAVLLSLIMAGYFYIAGSLNPSKKQDGVTQAAILAGGNKAVLTLSNGSKIILDDQHQDGVLARQGNVAVTKKSSGLLLYRQAVKNARSTIADTAIAYNTITTPRGGQYQVDLPDGTRVWLNSASSLRYPVSFKGKQRVVSLNGEAYFEVAHVNLHSGAMPFKVLVDNRQEVKVLGTHFNIMAYTDEDAIKTTLIQGSVQIIKGDKSCIIKPGEQAVVSNRIDIENADTEEAVAWKNGQTLFRNENIKTMMRQVARWYDVDISYQGELPQRLFTGGISRKSNLNSLIKIFNLNHIHCKVTGRTVIVTP